MLGTIFGDKFSFEKHYERAQEKSRVRAGITRRMAGRSWGLETAMLKLTGEALITSLLRFEKKTLARVDANIANFIARLILGVRCTARSPVLHPVSGVMSIRNLYVQHCGALVDPAMRAACSSIRSRINGLRCREDKVQTWEPKTVFAELPGIEDRVRELR